MENVLKRCHKRAYIGRLEKKIGNRSERLYGAFRHCEDHYYISFLGLQEYIPDLVDELISKNRSLAISYKPIVNSIVGKYKKKVYCYDLKRLTPKEIKDFKRAMEERVSTPIKFSN